MFFASTARSTKFLDQAIRTLERNDARKITEQLDASTGQSTSPIRASYVAICHTDLRQDLEQVPGYVPVEKYADQSDILDGEMGSARGIRFIGTTQATPFKDAGDTQNVGTQVSTGNSKSDVYPIIIMAQDAFGCATLGGKDSLTSTVVAPKPGPGDPLGQRADTFHGIRFSVVSCFKTCGCIGSNAPLLIRIIDFN